MMGELQVIWGFLKCCFKPAHWAWGKLPPRWTEPVNQFCRHRVSDVSDLIGHIFHANEYNRRSWPLILLFLFLSVLLWLKFISVFAWILNYLSPVDMPVLDSWPCSFLLFLLVIGSPLLVFIARFWTRHSETTSGNLEISQGLEEFSKWVCSAIDKDTTTVHVAANSPLLHSFYCRSKNGKALTAYEFEKEDCWGQLFCTPFIKRMAMCKNKLNSFAFLSIFPERLRNRVSWFPFADKSAFEDYTSSIDLFRDRLAMHMDKDRCWIDGCFHETHMLPMWIAVIHCKRPITCMPWTEFREDTVVLALTDRKHLQRRVKKSASVEEKKKEAKRIADQVMVLKCNDPRIVDFFDDVFERLISHTMEAPETIVNFLRQANDDKLRVVFQQEYSDEHEEFNAKSPAHVLYSTEK
jgi:hypothetical protein